MGDRMQVVHPETGEKINISVSSKKSNRLQPAANFYKKHGWIPKAYHISPGQVLAYMNTKSRTRYSQELRDSITAESVVKTQTLGKNTGSGMSYREKKAYAESVGSKAINAADLRDSILDKTRTETRSREETVQLQSGREGGESKIDMGVDPTNNTFATEKAARSLAAIEHEDAGRVEVIKSDGSVGGYTPGKKVKSIARSPDKVTTTYTSGEKEMVETGGRVTQISTAGDVKEFTATPESAQSYFDQSEIIQSQLNTEQQRYQREFKEQRDTSYAQGLFGIAVPPTEYMPRKQATNIQEGYMAGSTLRIKRDWREKTGQQFAPYKKLPEMKDVGVLKVSEKSQTIQSVVPSAGLGAFALGASLLGGKATPALKFEGAASVLNVTPTTARVVIGTTTLSKETRIGLFDQEFKDVQREKETIQQAAHDTETYWRKARDNDDDKYFETMFYEKYQPYKRAHEKRWAWYTAAVASTVTLGGALKPPQERLRRSDIRLVQEIGQTIYLFPKTAVDILWYGPPKALLYAGLAKEQVVKKELIIADLRQTKAIGIGILKTSPVGSAGTFSSLRGELAKERESIKQDYGGGVSRLMTESERAFKQGTLEAWKNPTTWVFAAVGGYSLAKGSFMKSHPVEYVYKSDPTARALVPATKTHKPFIRETTKATGVGVRPTPSIVNFIKTGNIIKYKAYKSIGIAKAKITQGTDGKIHIRYSDRVTQQRIVQDVKPITHLGKVIVKGGAKTTKYAGGKTVSVTKAVGQAWDAKTFYPQPAAPLVGGLKQYVTELHGTTTKTTFLTKGRIFVIKPRTSKPILAIKPRTAFGKTIFSGSKGFTIKLPGTKGFKPSFTNVQDFYLKGPSKMLADKPFLVWESFFQTGKIIHKPHFRLQHLLDKKGSKYTEVYKPVAVFKSKVWQTDLFRGKIGKHKLNIKHHTDPPTGIKLTRYASRGQGITQKSYVSWLKKTFGGKKIPKAKEPKVHMRLRTQSITDPYKKLQLKLELADARRNFGDQLRMYRFLKKGVEADRRAQIKTVVGKDTVKNFFDKQAKGEAIKPTGSRYASKPSSKPTIKPTAKEPYLSTLKDPWFDYKIQTPDKYVPGVDKLGQATTGTKQSTILIKNQADTLSTAPPTTSIIKNLMQLDQGSMLFNTPAGLYGGIAQPVLWQSNIVSGQGVSRQSVFSSRVSPFSTSAPISRISPIIQYGNIQNYGVGFSSILEARRSTIIPPRPVEKTTTVTKQSTVQDQAIIEKIIPITDVTPISTIPIINVPPMIGGGPPPPPPPPILFPFLAPGFGYDRRSPYNAATGKKRKKYTPSVTAIVFDIVGKQPISKGAKYSGLEFRPLLKKGKVKKNVWDKVVKQPTNKWGL